MRGLRIGLALGAAVVVAVFAPQARRAGAAGAPVAVDAAIVLAADVSRSIDDDEFGLQRRSRASNFWMRSPPDRTARLRSPTSNGPATARTKWWSTGR